MGACSCLQLLVLPAASYDAPVLSVDTLLPTAGGGSIVITGLNFGNSSLTSAPIVEVEGQSILVANFSDNQIVTVPASPVGRSEVVVSVTVASQTGNATAR